MFRIVTIIKRNRVFGVERFVQSEVCGAFGPARSGPSMLRQSTDLPQLTLGPTGEN